MVSMQICGYFNTLKSKMHERVVFGAGVGVLNRCFCYEFLDNVAKMAIIHRKTS